MICMVLLMIRLFFKGLGCALLRLDSCNLKVILLKCLVNTNYYSLEVVLI